MKNLRILWIRKNPSTNSFTLPKNFKVCKDLEKDVQKDEFFLEDILEGYAAIACLLEQKGLQIRFMEEDVFIKEVEGMNKSAFSNLDLIVYGNWPIKCNNLPETYQKLENLSVFGIEIFPSPSDILFAGNKHR